MYLITDRIEKLYNSNSTFNKKINSKLHNNDYKFYILTNNIKDHILQYNDAFNFHNFTEHFSNQLLKLNDYDFMSFTYNSLCNKYSLNENIYNKIRTEIFKSLSDIYDIDISLVKENRKALENICENLFEIGDISTLYKIRKFLTDNFRINGFNSYLKENKSAAIKILKQSNTDVSNKKYLRIEALLKDHPGYLGAFVYFAFKLNISYNRLKNLYERILKNKAHISKLPKNIIEYHRIEELEDDLDNLERIVIATKYANEYPRLRMIRNNPEFINISNELWNLSQKEKSIGEAYNIIFLPKVSMYKTQDELIKGLKSFIRNHSYDDFYDKISKYEDIKKVYESDTFLVLRYLDYPELKDTCSDTSWCISRDLDYWLSYHGEVDSVFMVIIDKSLNKLDIKSKIGVTYDENGRFRTAHQKNDHSISKILLNNILNKDNINLDYLYNIAHKLGINKYYDVERDHYGNIVGYDESIKWT